MSDHLTLSQLDAAQGFADRHIGPDPTAQERMLAALGFGSLHALMDAAVPGGIRAADDLDLPVAATEEQTARELRALAAANNPREPMIGLGYHGTITPAVVRRNVLEDPSWYTAYTPYQPEISQGRLEALLNFQTMVGDLTGLPTANASLLDEGTAAAEAMTLVRRGNKAASGPFVVDANALPQTIAVVQTRARAMGIEVTVADLAEGLPEGELCGVLVQYPGADGHVPDPRPVIEAAHERGAMAVVAADLLALTLLEAPGELGADVVVGSTQRFGVPLFYGGPHAGYMSVRAGLERHLPGRLVGVSVDAEGRPAYRLALQTREQHIRRDKATSNICTAQVLLAVVASMYAVYHGPDGLRSIARRTHRYAAVLAAALREAGVEVRHEQLFDTVTARVPGRARRGRGPRPRGRGRPPAAGRRRHGRGVHRRDHDASPRGRRAGGVRRRRLPRTGWSGWTTSTPGSAWTCPRPCAEPPASSATRCSTAIAPRPRCCATCAGCPRGTTPWTAA